MRDAKFDINPHVIRQLGAELVSDQVTALLELIKNSYDADASYVKIEIDTVGKCSVGDLYNPEHKGYILVEDNGFGMDEETILKSWLIISYSKKRAVDGVKPKTPKGRTPLGDKGLGRLSTQRLANCCEIYTKKENTTPIHVGFKWSDFDSVERLSEVNVNFHSTEFKQKCGTKLYLLDLIDTTCWQGAGLERLKGALCQIIAPYKELRPFNVYLSINGDVIDIAQEITKLEKLNICDINFQYIENKINVQIDVHLRKLIGNDYETYQNIIAIDNGKRFTEYLFKDKKGRGKCFKQLDNGYWLHTDFSAELSRDISIFDLDINEHMDNPGDFKGRIQEFTLGAQDQDKSWWSNLYRDFQEYKNFVQSQTGIKIYRNGFAVRPYGIDSNDWLNLGHGQTSGSSYYGLRPSNVVGYISIDEGINKNLRDKTDREGLIENASYRIFYELIQVVVRRYAEIMENLRRCYNEYRSTLSDENTRIKSTKQAFEAINEQAKKGKKTAKDYGEVQTKLSQLEAKIDKVIKSESSSSLFNTPEDSLLHQILREIQQILLESKEVLQQAKEILNNSKYLSEALYVLKPKLETLETQLLDFSELASLGLISEMVTHDLNLISNRLLARGVELDKQLKNSEEVTKMQLYALVDFIRSTVTSLRSQMRHLDPSLKYNREKRDVFSLKKMLEEEEIPYYVNKLRDKDIAILLKVDEDFKVDINKGRLMQVFDNLINNSIYWLDKRFDPIETTKPQIVIRIDKPWVYVEDNGEGIDPSVANILFEPFITRKPRGEGRGLGLFIVRQLLDQHKCDIMLDNILNAKGNRYRFVLNLKEILCK